MSKLLGDPSMGVREAAAGYGVILDQIYEALIAELASVNEKVERSHAGAGSSRNPDSQTPRWREQDSNHRSRCVRKAPRLLPKGDAGPISWMGSLSSSRLARRRWSAAEPLRGRLFLGGTDGSNPVPSTSELGELRIFARHGGARRAPAKGGTTPALAVVINATVDALAELGVRHIEMPATPERVWRAIREATAQE